MKLYSKNDRYKLYQGSMLDMLDVIEPETIDSIVTDPPYELNFMSKGWDNAGVSFKKETWQKCYEVLKPGGYLLAFGGSRTFHRIACAIEDAGFEIRDTIMWLYGSGFPKSQNIGKMYDKKMGNDREKIVETKIGKTSLGDGSGWDTSQNMKELKATGKIDITKGTSKWEGWGSCLKPSFEPIIVARKPFKGSLVDNVIKNGVGGINIDECRVAFNGDKWKSQKSGNTAKAFNLNEQQREAGTGVLAGYECEANENGRFPANTILTYDETDFDEVCGGFPNTKGGTRHNTCERKSEMTSFGFQNNTRNEFNDSGSASRYFYCAKASKKDRDEGLDEFEEKQPACVTDFRPTLATHPENWNNGNPVVNPMMRTTPRKNVHPTVKPTSLMQYLVRLVTPNGGTILDPFNGSGSTGKAVMYENLERGKNYKYIGIELTEEYLPIAKARIEYVCNQEQQTTIDDFIGDSNE
jgi:site-specific DNA-methyltransferase (adenine-specific)